MAGNIMTMNDDIARTILRILCSQPSCRTDIQTLKLELRRYDIRQHVNLDIFLDDYSNHFMVVDGIVTAFTTLEICPHHCQKKGRCEQDYCNKLHVCKFFLLSQCTYERLGVCQFGHDLDSPHNRPLIKGHLLDGLKVPLIQRLFRSGQSRTSLTMPLVCKFYNHKQGCTRKMCPHLHICQYYVEGSCKFGTGCHRNHDINNAQVLKVLNRFGIDMQRRPRDILQDLRMSLSRESRGDNMMRYSSMPSLSMAGLSSQAMPPGRHRPSRVQRMSEGPGSSPMGGRDEICKYHLRGGKGCSFGSNCYSLHLDSPYQWQYREGPDTDWLHFEDFTNKTIERSFRDVDSSECTVCFDSDSDDSDSDSDSEEDHGKGQGEIIVDFHTMKALGQGRQLEVRRLSTASTISVHPQIARSFRQYLTGWIWYWFDDVTKQWIEYGQKGQDGKSSQVDSSDIEKAFLTGQENVQFLVGPASFKIKFSTMTQKNVITRKKKVVRRRPEPIY